MATLVVWPQCRGCRTRAERGVVASALRRLGPWSTGSGRGCPSMLGCPSPSPAQPEQREDAQYPEWCSLRSAAHRTTTARRVTFWATGVVAHRVARCGIRTIVRRQLIRAEILAVTVGTRTWLEAIADSPNAPNVFEVRRMGPPGVAELGWIGLFLEALWIEADVAVEGACRVDAIEQRACGAGAKVRRLGIEENLLVVGNEIVFLDEVGRAATTAGANTRLARGGNQDVVAERQP